MMAPGFRSRVGPAIQLGVPRFQPDRFFHARQDVQEIRYRGVAQRASDAEALEVLACHRSSARLRPWHWDDIAELEQRQRSLRVFKLDAFVLDAGIHFGGQRIRVDLQAHAERRKGIDRFTHLFHLKLVGPLGLVAEGFVSEDVLAPAMTSSRSCGTLTAVSSGWASSPPQAVKVASAATLALSSVNVAMVCPVV